MALGKEEEVSIMVGTDRRAHLDCSLNGSAEPLAKAAKLSSAVDANRQTRGV